MMANPTMQKKIEGKGCFEVLFQHATEGIMVVNEDGEINRMNPVAEKLFGYSENDLVGKPIEVCIPERFHEKHIENRDKHNQSFRPMPMPADKEFYGLTKDGKEFPVEISLSPHSEDDGKYTIVFIVDLTSRKEAEVKMQNYSTEMALEVKNRTLILEAAIEELEQTKKDLKVSLEKEKELNELKSRFVSMASHEFRTPLATIQSSLSLVKKYGNTQDKEKQDKHISKIKSSINNLTDILNDFLSVSKLEEGKVENNAEELHLQNFVSELISEVQEITKNDQRIVYCHSGNDIVKLDETLLRNILFNLASNAIKFSREGQTIQISTDVTKTSVKVTVQDSGMGIPVEDQKHLFERFFRGRNATHIQGTGLGLNIVAKYVELMNGTINASSEEYIGTTFTIIFPQ